MQPMQPGPLRKADGSLVFMCNCTGSCHGRWTELESRKTYQRHAPNRINPAQFLASNDAGRVAGPAGPPRARDVNVSQTFSVS